MDKGIKRLGVFFLTAVCWFSAFYNGYRDAAAAYGAAMLIMMYLDNLDN